MLEVFFSELVEDCRVTSLIRFYLWEKKKIKRKSKEVIVTQKKSKRFNFIYGSFILEKKNIILSSLLLRFLTLNPRGGAKPSNQINLLLLNKMSSIRCGEYKIKGNLVMIREPHNTQNYEHGLIVVYIFKLKSINC